MRNYSCVNLAYFGSISDDAEFARFFFDSLDDELLSIRTIEVTSRVSASSISEGSISIEYLDSFLYLKGHIPPVIVRILSINYRFGNIYGYSPKYIYDIFESRKIYHKIVIDRLSGNLRYFISKIGDSDFISFSEVVEAIDSSRSSSIWIGYIEITRQREEGDDILLFIQRCQHDGISEITSVMSFSSYSGNQYICRAFHFFSHKFFYDSFWGEGF